MAAVFGSSRHFLTVGNVDIGGVSWYNVGVVGIATRNIPVNNANKAANGLRQQAFGEQPPDNKGSSYLNGFFSCLSKLKAVVHDL